MGNQEIVHSSSFNPKKANPMSCRGDQIHAASGAKFIIHPVLRLYGAHTWTLELNYHSLLLQEGVLGIAWTHNYEMRVEASDDGSLTVWWNTGRCNRFDKQESDVYRSFDAAVRFDELSVGADGTYRLWCRETRETYLFHADGKLTRHINTLGLAFLASYDAAGQLTSLTDEVSGSKLVFSYGEDGLLRQVSDGARCVKFSYDERRHLVQFTDPIGIVSELAYTEEGRILSLHVAGELKYRNAYDEQARIIAQTDASGRTSSFMYDTAYIPGYVVTVFTDRTGAQHILIHDERYLLIAAHSPDDSEIEYTYNEDGQMTSRTNLAQETDYFAYDEEGRLIKRTDPRGNAYTYTYGERYQLLSETDPEGGVTAYAYDEKDRLIRICSPDGSEERIEYNALGQRTSYTDFTGGKQYYLYDDSGRLSSHEDAEGRLATFLYDGVGRMNAFTDALGGTTIRTYDAADRLISVSDPIGRQWQYWYDSQDRLVSETSPSGATIEYRYSLSGELRSVTDALGNTTVFAYDDEGRLTETVNPNGARTLYEYDGVGKRTAVVDPLGRRISYSYNAVGRLKDIRDAAGQTAVRAVYDASGNVAQVSDALDRATRYRYNGLGRAVEVTDARGDKTVFAYDTAARLIEVVQSDTAVYTQQFDGENRLMRYSDANGNETTLAYDRSGKLTAERNAAGGTLCYSYDERGWLTERKNARGMSTKRSYDEAGQLVGVRDGAGVIELDYDSDGNLIRIEQAGANAKLRTYDALGRATSYTDAFGHTIHYAYDEAGYLTELIYPNGEAVHYRYNAAGQLTEARDWEGRVTRYDYDADGRLVRTGRPNGTLELRKYNEAGEVARLQNQLANGIVLQKYEFIYNELGQIIQEEEKRYTYDNLGRLAGGSMPGRKLFYRYDLAGNVTDTVTEGEAPGEHPLGTQLPLTYTKDNRLFAIGGLPVEYDADGNLLYVTDGKRMEAYTYDARDRLVRTGKTTYAYDAENVRTQVAHEGHTTRYVVDPQGGLSRVLWETDEEGNVKAKYVYGLGLIGRYVARGRYQSYHYDLRGSTVMLTDEHGKVTDRYAYGFYGEMEKHEGSTEQPFQYIGRDGVMTDPNRLCYMRARYYHPGLKRFLNRNAIRGDITDGQTFNRFAYVNGDPVNFIAPLGLTKECVGGKTSRGWGFSGPFWTQSGDFAGDCPINNHMQLARRISGNGGQITAIYSYLPAGVRNL